MKHARSHAGNAFFLILLGVVLFAAFSAAVLRTTSQSGSTNPERDKLDASLIIKYGGVLRSAVNQMRALGISESDISFANATVTGYGTLGTNAPAEVFNSSGGGIAYEIPNSRWLDGVSTAQTGYGEWVFTGADAIRFGVGTPLSGYCSAASCKELVAILPYIKKAICLEINKQLGIGGATPTIYQDVQAIQFTKFTGTFGANSDSIGDSADNMKSQLQGCIEGGGSGPAAGTYHYYQVLIAR